MPIFNPIQTTINQYYPIESIPQVENTSDLANLETGNTTALVMGVSPRLWANVAYQPISGNFIQSNIDNSYWQEIEVSLSEQDTKVSFPAKWNIPISNQPTIRLIPENVTGNKVLNTSSLALFNPRQFSINNGVSWEISENTPRNAPFFKSSNTFFNLSACNPYFSSNGNNQVDFSYVLILNSPNLANFFWELKLNSIVLKRQDSTLPVNILENSFGSEIAVNSSQRSISWGEALVIVGFSYSQSDKLARVLVQGQTGNSTYSGFLPIQFQAITDIPQTYGILEAIFWPSALTETELSSVFVAAKSHYDSIFPV